MERSNIDVKNLNGGGYTTTAAAAKGGTGVGCSHG